MDSFENDALETGFRTVAGVDEAGRGPLAGPVVAAAVVYSPSLLHLGIRDSKKLTRARRERLALEIYRSGQPVGVGVVWSEEVDAINIHHASLKAMRKAVKALPEAPENVLVDGRFVIDSLDIPQRAVIGGDSLSVSIGAASIIAKTSRDAIMAAYHVLYPRYNFLKNKGYPTREHVASLRANGPCPIHRKSFSLYGKSGA